MKNIFKLTFLVCILFSASIYATPVQTTTAQQQQLQTVTDYYKKYLNREFEEGWPSIFSSRLQKALNDNIEDCRKYVRNGNICGYSSDGDLLLLSQDSSEKLNFTNSKFTAISEHTNQINVSFILFPEYPDDAGNREISFNMAQENNQWKIDDIESQAYASMDSEKAALIEYNQSLENALEDLRIAFELADSKAFEKFITNKTQICSSKSCKTINTDSISIIFQTIFDKYYRKTGEYTVEQKHPLYPQPALKTTAPKEGDTATIGIFSWVYENTLWVIAKIDWDKI